MKLTCKRCGWVVRGTDENEVIELMKWHVFKGHQPDNSQTQISQYPSTSQDIGTIAGQRDVI